MPKVFSIHIVTTNFKFLIAGRVFFVIVIYVWRNLRFVVWGFMVLVRVQCSGLRVLGFEGFAVLRFKGVRDLRF